MKLKSQSIETPPSSLINVRITGVHLASFSMCLPQGDPDNNNQPRLDSDGRAFMTGAGYRRKTRDTAVYMGYPIQIVRGGDLSASVLASAAELGFDLIDEKPITDESGEAAAAVPTKPAAAAKKGEKTDKPGVVRRKGHALKQEEKDAIIKLMGKKYFDCCAYGGVNTALNHGEPGPVQIGFGVTIDPVETMDLTTTRVAVANAKELEKKDRTMGSITVVKYGLMKFESSFCPKRAARTGFTWGHFDTFVEINKRMFDLTKSTGRSRVVNEKLVFFVHSSPLGDCQDATLHDAVKAEWVTKTDGDLYPRSIKDYRISIDKTMVPDSVEIIDISL